MAPQQKDMKLLVACGDRTVRDRCLSCLESLGAGGQLSKEIQDFVIRPVELSTLEQTYDALQDHFGNRNTESAVVLSDLLAEPSDSGEGWEPSSAARELRQQFSMQSFATIAVVDDSKRVPEIDHSLFRGFDQGDFLDKLKITADKLSYLSRPDRQQLKHPIVIREIKTQTEMRAYFKLRYRVYNVMGYIEEGLLRAKSRLEMDWCDTTAIHLGAFAQLGLQERLVGCARVVNAANRRAAADGYTVSIAREDPVLTRTIDRTFLPLRLPIFQSARSSRLNEILKEVEMYERNCGELSRVIVDKAYRGFGLATLLVKFAVFKANQCEIGPLLLECLEVHAPFYEKFGFRQIPGEENRVLGVERSMVAMEVVPTSSMDFISGVEVFLTDQRLCACKHKSCYQGTYNFFGTEKCPLMVLTF